MITKMKRKEKACFDYAQRWNKNWDNYCLVVSSFFEGYNTAKEFIVWETTDTGNELVEVDVGMHQLEQNHRRGLLDYKKVITKFFKDLNSEDIRINEAEDGTISVQASFKGHNGRTENL